MINEQISFELPLPWENQRFETDQIGAINYLVGPNGSGKSQFARALFDNLKEQSGGFRILGTDRLSAMAAPGPLQTHMIGDPFSGGYAKSNFSVLRRAGTEGSGIDTIVLLEERMDLRIQIEATLGHLFNRDITMEWDSGNIIPMVKRRGGRAAYRLDHDECHGIKELLVLLTHLYDDKVRYLIVDEPELNLHPQYQAFFMQEVRRVTSDPAMVGPKKIVFLITHSPFVLDLCSEDDLNSVISFDLEYSVPKQVASLNLDAFSSTFATGRLNAHHKQLFFSDNPIFVEGPHDAVIVEALMEARGVSVAGAGSCIIDAGGVEEVNQYLKLCQGLRKEAHFVYDLDSLFRGKLRQCIRDDESIQNFLALTGMGSDFGNAFSLLESDLRDLIETLLVTSLHCNLKGLGDFLSDLGDRNQWGKEGWSKARVAVMTAISAHREDILSVMTRSTVESIEGRRNQILAALEEKNIHVLPGGTLERYLPCFMGDVYRPAPDAKRQAIASELSEIQKSQEDTGPAREDALGERYGDLYSVVRKLPSKKEIDLDPVLRKHIIGYVNELQVTVAYNPDWHSEQIKQHMSLHELARNGVSSLRDFERNGNAGFIATIGIAAMLGNGPRTLQANERTTIANLKEFEQDQADIAGC